MKDYEITVKIRNNYLLTAMRQAGVPNGFALVRATGVGANHVYGYLSLTDAPLHKITGEWKPSIKKIAAFLNRNPIELFPSQHIDAVLEKSKASFTASLEDLPRLINEGLIQIPEMPDAAVEREEMAADIHMGLETLNPRDREIIERRFGLNGKEVETLAQIAEDEGCSPANIRRLESRGLRRLKNPSRSRHLRTYIEGEQIRDA